LIVSAAETRGLLWGTLGVALFSPTLPATRAAVPSLGVGFVALGRIAGAGVLACIILGMARQPLPRREQLFGLLLTSAGVVIGFPFLTTLAMAHVPASHGAVVVGLLPLSTAVASVLLAGERPSLAFWLTSLAGTGILLAFILQTADGRIDASDLALLGAVAAAAYGYAKGGQLAAELGGWQVICWALVPRLPVAALLCPFVANWPSHAAPLSAWLGFGYVTLVSQLLGFFAWYHGLSTGGIARVSQTQLLQLFLTLAASALLLGEPVGGRLLLYGAAVVATVALATRLQVSLARS
jgi:drug/metabolite transporter (DMT)-like permease